MAREDDIHDGYLIPKGSIIIPNNWYAMSQNLKPLFSLPASNHLITNTVNF